MTAPHSTASTNVSTRVALSSPIPIALRQEVERRVLFVAPEIIGYELHGDDTAIHAATLFSRMPLAADEVAGKLNRLIDNDVRTQRVGTTKTIWASPHRRAIRGNTFAALADAGIVHEAGEGQIAVSEPLLSLLDYFDRAVLELLAEDFDAQRFRYPTLIRTDALANSGYMTSFPQHLMFVTRLRNDVDVYRDFLGSHPESGVGPDVLQFCGNVAYCLPPTMCYHTFQQLSGRCLDPGRLHVVTARGKSFRFEAGYSAGLERLWDFTIREIVFLGSRDDVLSARELFIQKVFAFIDGLGLSGCCEVGNDPFFGGTDTSARIWSQRFLELKYELRLPVAEERSIAVASFNFHDDLFGRVFDIRHGAQGPIRSGCVGFGLERLTYAFLCQYGLDARDWPHRVRANAGSSGS